MTTDLWMLVATGALALFLSSVPQFRAMRQQWGFAKMLGNRDDLPPLTGWGGRTARAYNNLMDNIVLFGAAVLTVHVAGAANETSALMAQVFFGARIVHAVTYIAGIPYVRTVAYLVGAYAIIKIAMQLPGAA